MSDYADLEIGLSPHEEGTYKIYLRYTPPGADGEFSPEEKPTIDIDSKELKKYHLRNDDYGQKLADYLFEHKVVSDEIIKARAAASQADVPLRLRLAIGRKATELHSLRWETLFDPEDKTSRLLTNPKYLFSRFFLGSGGHPFQPGSKSELKALVAVANPDSLQGHEVLAPVDVDGELQRAQEGLGDIKITALGKVEDQSWFEGIEIRGRATLPQIQDELQKGYPILYLACHGGLDNEEPKLWLDPDEADERDYVPGQDLITRLKSLEEPPLLVILASCQSAGTGDQPRTSDDAGALAALGPQLASAGIPAVLAMQGSITMKTVSLFMPILFRELEKDGRIDRAVAIARSKVQERPDWWMPVLFMRSKSGRLWIEGKNIKPRLSERIFPFEPETVPIPAGNIVIGSEGYETEHDLPQREIFLDEYRISKYPITNEEYAIFINETKHNNPKVWGWDGPVPPASMRRLPVQGVTWFEAMAYCSWLSDKTKRSYCLPSEVQWEKAARGIRGSRYPWGDEWKENCCNPNRNEVKAVDEYSAQNEYDCYDMVGNVREWTRTVWGVMRPWPDKKFDLPQDEDKYLIELQERERTDYGGYIYRVYRGGGISHDVDESTVRKLRCSARAAFSPRYAGPPSNYHGFRVVLNLKDEASAQN